MKRTTYILLGILLGGLLLSMVGVFVIALFSKKFITPEISFVGEQAEMELDNIRFFKVSVLQKDEKDKINVFVHGKLTITSSETKGKLVYPQSKFIHLTQKKDTLTLTLEPDFTAYNVPKDYKTYVPHYINNLYLNLEVGPEFSYLYNSARGLDVNFSKLKSDSLVVEAYDHFVTLDSCQFRSVDFSGKDIKLNVDNSKIERFYLNLDAVQRWSVKNTAVGTEYLTGSNIHSGVMEKGSCHRMIWTPKNQDAKLQMTFTEKANIWISE